MEPVSLSPAWQHKALQNDRVTSRVRTKLIERSEPRRIRAAATEYFEEVWNNYRQAPDGDPLARQSRGDIRPLLGVQRGARTVTDS